MSVGKQNCPTCGQSVNLRRVRLGKHHVQAILKVGAWLKRYNRTEASMTELRQVLTSVQYATFNEWRNFAPHIVWGKRGHYQFNTEAIRGLFLDDEIGIEYLVNPLEKTITRTAKGTIHDAKGVKEFLDENNQFVAQYMGRVDPNTKQGVLL